MTLRQEYARPHPRAIARHTDPARPSRRSRPHRPAQDQPSASAGPRRAATAATPASRGQAVSIGAPRPRTPAQPGRATGWTPAAWLHKSGPLPPFPAARARRGDLPLQSAPAACPAGSVSGGLLPQVAGFGCFLWVSCGCPAGRPVWWALSPPVMVRPAATAAPPDQRQVTRLRHQGDRNAPGPAPTRPPRPRPPARNGRHSHAGPSPRLS
jgi:hypothetical protein